MKDLMLKALPIVCLAFISAEINLLKGAYETIQRDKPAIFIEKTITNDNDLVNFLNDLGYDIFKEFEKDILFKKIK